MPPGGPASLGSVRAGGMTGLKDNCSLFPETGKDSEQLRDHWISLIVLWVALWESISKTEGAHPPGLWKLSLGPGGLRVANIKNFYEVMSGKYGVLTHISLLVLIWGREHCFKVRKVHLGPKGACPLLTQNSKRKAAGSPGM